MPIIAFINSYFSFFYIKKMAWAIYVSIKDFIGVLSLTLIFDTHCGGEWKLYILFVLLLLVDAFTIWRHLSITEISEGLLLRLW